MSGSLISRLLVVSHSPQLTTGYGRVVNVLSRGLVEAGHQIAILGFGYRGEPIPQGLRIHPWKSIQDQGAIAQAITSERAGLIVTIGDPWMFDSLVEPSKRQGVKWLAYFPVDGEPLPSEWKNWIGATDQAAVFCKWTCKVVEKETGVRPTVIPHGVDTSVFSPRDKQWAKARVGVERKFVVGCVAANQQRKNLPALVKGFAAFAGDKQDVILYLHTQIDGYWDIQELVRRFGVEKKTRATLNLDPQHGVSDDILATIYNSFDVFVLPTMAEGFGLPILESQACAVPTLVTDFSACSELVPDSFCRLRVKDTLIMARNFEQAIVDEADITAKLQRVYDDPQWRGVLGEQARRFACGYQWADICPKFVDLVESLANA